MTRPPLAALMRQALVRFGAALLILGTALFGTAGTFRYWQAWVWLAVLFLPMTLLLRHLVRNDPALLERRMRVRERERVQAWIVAVSAVCYAASFLLPGLDRRLSWSEVPTGVVLVADLAVLLGYGLFARVLLENPYAARTVAVEPGQRLVDTGPYAVVRHPMYVAVLVMFLASPLALGSWWAALPSLLLPFLMAARIRNEEAVLLRELPGYGDYVTRTRYRLMPGLW